MSEFFLEKRLKEKNPELHQRMRDGIIVLQQMLQSYQSWFPGFTDHTILHSMTVLDFCNRILGESQIQRLTAEECNVLIMACYLHDAGMGISKKDFEEFSKEIDFGDYFETNPEAGETDIIRAFHHDYSGLLIRKYAEFFDIPSEELVFSLIQVSRGHRKTDLYDETEYPDLQTENGTIRTSLLAAIIRLADEIDVASDRNPELLYDSSKLKRKENIEAFGTHESITRVEILEDSIALYIKPKGPEYIPLIEKLVKKVQETLDYCRDVVEKRSDFRIAQEKVVLIDDDA